MEEIEIDPDDTAAFNHEVEHLAMIANMSRSRADSVLRRVYDLGRKRGFSDGMDEAAGFADRWGDVYAVGRAIAGKLRGERV